MEFFGGFLKPPGHFQPVLAMKFCVESEFRDQEPPRTQEIVKIDVKIFKMFENIFGKNPYIPYIAL